VYRTAEEQVFYDMDYLRKQRGHYLTILSGTPEADGYQPAMVLEKSSNSGRDALTTTPQVGWQV